MRNIFWFFSVSRHFQILLTETRLTLTTNTFLHNALKVCKATSGLRDSDRKGKERKAACPICAKTQCKAAAVPSGSQLAAGFPDTLLKVLAS